MKLSQSIKPISYFKSHASEIIKSVSENQETIVITQNGEAKAVIQDVKSYDNMQESLALLKILLQSKNSMEEGKYKTIEDSFASIRKNLKL